MVTHLHASCDGVSLPPQRTTRPETLGIFPPALPGSGDA